ncbi:hypothetical protein, partial [Aureimonas sp. AU4]|uniref:hypothetical protein n=1 Tax=Aureimonas sp. AU4 TaxID=1638163 RepID=UPI000AEEF944
GGRAAFSDYVEDVVLAADALQRVAIPSGARFALFSFDADVRVKIGSASATLTLPAGSTTDGSGSELNPAARRVPAMLQGSGVLTHVLLRSAAACCGSISFYGRGAR